MIGLRDVCCLVCARVYVDCVAFYTFAPRSCYAFCARARCLVGLRTAITFDLDLHFTFVTHLRVCSRYVVRVVDCVLRYV